MRILFLNDDYPPLGKSSVSSVVVGLAQEMTKRGHEVGVVTTHRMETNREIIRDGNVVSLPISYRTSLRQYRSLWNSRVSRMVAEEVQKFRPDVVHAHNIHMYLTYDALRMARKHCGKVFITMHDVMSFAYARLATERFLHSGGINARLTVRDACRSAGLQWNPLRNLWIRSVLKKNTNSVIAVSNALQRALESHGIPRVTKIWNGMDVHGWDVSKDEAKAFRSEHGLTDRKVILFGGRLSLDKGTTPLLQALSLIRKRVPSVMLLVIGDEKRWTALVRASGVEDDLSAHVKCVGWLGREETKRAFFAADVVTTPSLCLDTFNLMNLEAMAAHKPVVGTMFGGTPEVVADGKTGFVVDPRDVRDYAARLTLLLEDDELARKMGDAGRKRAEEHFSLARQVEEHLELYTHGYAHHTA